MAVWYSPNHGTEFRTLRLFLDSSGLGCECCYPGRLWVPEWLENAFRASFGSGTAEKCMLNSVCYFPIVEFSGLSLDYWSRMTSLCGLFLVCYC